MDKAMMTTSEELTNPLLKVDMFDNLGIVATVMVCAILVLLCALSCFCRTEADTRERDPLISSRQQIRMSRLRDTY